MADVISNWDTTPVVKLVSQRSLTNEHEQIFEMLEPIIIKSKGGTTMIAVGIDLSKSKSTIAILSSDG